MDVWLGISIKLQGWRDEYRDVWMLGWINGYKDYRCMDEGMNILIYGWRDEYMDVWMKGWIYGWMDEYVWWCSCQVSRLERMNKL